tara:strand:- start:10579 stop:10995 length:417 start_codon:yes stop_codon:yes gene_type:complete
MTMIPENQKTYRVAYLKRNLGDVDGKLAEAAQGKRPQHKRIREIKEGFGFTGTRAVEFTVVCFFVKMKRMRCDQCPHFHKCEFHLRGKLTRSSRREDHGRNRSITAQFRISRHLIVPSQAALHLHVKPEKVVPISRKP